MKEDWTLLACVPWEHRDPDYPGGHERRKCEFCDEVVAVSRINYTRAARDGFPVKVTCMLCALLVSVLSPDAEIRGALRYGKADYDNEPEN